MNTFILLGLPILFALQLITRLWKGPHPAPATLQAYFEDLVTLQESEKITLHIERCRSCRNIAENY